MKDEPRQYATAAAFRVALEARLKATEQAEGIDLQRLRRQVSFDRLLEPIRQIYGAKCCFLSLSKSLKEQTKTTEEGKAHEVRELLLPTDQQAAARAEPGESALDFPAVAITAQRAAVRRHVFRAAIPAMRGDHCQTQFRKGLIQFITVISLVAQQAFRLGFLGKKAESFLHHVPRGHVRRRHACPQRKSRPINDQLHLCPLAFLRPDSFATTFGGRESGVNQALVEIDPPLSVGSSSRGTPMAIVPMKGGTMKSESGFSPAIDAKFKGVGNDYVHNDPTGKHMRLELIQSLNDGRQGLADVISTDIIKQAVAPLIAGEHQAGSRKMAAGGSDKGDAPPPTEG